MAKEKRYFKFKNSNDVFESSEVEGNGPFENLDEITKANYDAYIQIKALKNEIAQTDYIACKLAECDTAEERAVVKSTYATQLARRAEIRALINELEEDL